MNLAVAWEPKMLYPGFKTTEAQHGRWSLAVKRKNGTFRKEWNLISKALSEYRRIWLPSCSTSCLVTLRCSWWHPQCLPSNSFGSPLGLIVGVRKGVVLQWWQCPHCTQRSLLERYSISSCYQHIPNWEGLSWLSPHGRVGGSVPGSTTCCENETPKGTHFYGFLGGSQWTYSLVCKEAKG